MPGRVTGPRSSAVARAGFVNRDFSVNSENAPFSFCFHFQCENFQVENFQVPRAVRRR